MSIDSIDSVMSPRTPKCHKIMKVACQYWRLLEATLKKSWNDRAEKLNNRSVPGKFISVPSIIDASDICDIITLYWANLVKTFRICMIWKPRAGDSLVEYVFGNERAILNN